MRTRRNPKLHHFARELRKDMTDAEHRLWRRLRGGQHADQQAYDQQRDLFLQHQGYRVLRFWNHDVLQQTESVMTEILKHCQLPR